MTLWVMGLPNGYVCFRRDLRRTNEAAFALLKGFKGLLQCDGYASYGAFARNHPGVRRGGCWAHGRRAFFEARKEDPHQPDPASHRTSLRLGKGVGPQVYLRDILTRIPATRHDHQR
ncbi:MAG: transposase [Opitutales bacterium]|nr:transposase [Opitutales bacterium]